MRGNNAEEKAPPTIDSLPNELLSAIFTHLSPGTLARIAGVSKLWALAVIPHIYRDFSSTKNATRDANALLNAPVERKAAISRTVRTASFFLKRADMFDSEPGLRPMFGVLGQHMREMVDPDAFPAWDSVWKRPFPAFVKTFGGKLNRVRLEGERRELMYFMPILAKMESLEAVAFIGWQCGFAAWRMRPPPVLTKIEITECMISLQDLTDFVLVMDQLVSLKVVDCTIGEPADVLAVHLCGQIFARHAKTLTELEFAGEPFGFISSAEGTISRRVVVWTGLLELAARYLAIADGGVLECLKMGGLWENYPELVADQPSWSANLRLGVHAREAFWRTMGEQLAMRSMA